MNLAYTCSIHYKSQPSQLRTTEPIWSKLIVGPFLPQGRFMNDRI